MRELADILAEELDEVEAHAQRIRDRLAAMRAYLADDASKSADVLEDSA